MATSYSATFTVQCRTLPGETVFLSGDRTELGAWEVSSAVAMSTTEASWPSWTTTVAFAEAALVQYKFFVQRASGECTWELGNNRLRNITQDEDIDASVFQSHTFEASDQQYLQAVLDHQRYYEAFPSVTELHALEDKIEGLYEVIASMHAQNTRLAQALADTQRERGHLPADVAAGAWAMDEAVAEVMAAVTTAASEQETSGASLSAASDDTPAGFKTPTSARIPAPAPAGTPTPAPTATPTPARTASALRRGQENVTASVPSAAMCTPPPHPARTPARTAGTAAAAAGASAARRVLSASRPTKPADPKSYAATGTGSSMRSPSVL